LEAVRFGWHLNLETEPVSLLASPLLLSSALAGPGLFQLTAKSLAIRVIDSWFRHGLLREGRCGCLDNILSAAIFRYHCDPDRAGAVVPALLFSTVFV
jgi:hypothetical protein